MHRWNRNDRPTSTLNGLPLGGAGWLIAARCHSWPHHSDLPRAENAPPRATQPVKSADRHTWPALLSAFRFWFRRAPARPPRGA